MNPLVRRDDQRGIPQVERRELGHLVGIPSAWFYALYPSQTDRSMGKVSLFGNMRRDHLVCVAGQPAVGARIGPEKVRGRYGVKPLQPGGDSCRWPLSHQAEDLRLYRRIATMDASATLPKITDRGPTWDIAAALAREWELNELAERLTRMASSDT